MSHTATPAERAAALNMVYVDPERAVLLTVKRMAEDFWRTTTDPDLRRRIADAYQKLIGAPIHNFAGDTENFSSMHLKGPPGHGKSSIVSSAARLFARMVGMNFHATVPSETLGKNDLLLVTREMTGEVSTLSTRGIFDKTSFNGKEVTRRVPYLEFEAARSAGLAVLLFDDISSALDTVQTSLLGLVRQRHAEGESYRNMFVVLSGNLGLEDGTMTNPGTAALTGRSLTLYLEDDVDSFSKRIHAKFGGDTLGDGFVTTYLHHHPERFSPTQMQMTDPRQPRPQPRTWEALAISMRALVNAYRHNPDSPLFAPSRSSEGIVGAIRQEAAMSVGWEAAQEFAAFCQSIMSETLPLAQSIFERGPAHAQDPLLRVIERAGQGVRTSSQGSEPAFQYQYAESCAAVAAARLAARPEMMEGSPQQLRRAIAEELSLYLQALNEPFLLSDGQAFILNSYQTRATWTLGRRMSAMPALASSATAADSALERRRLRLDLVVNATADAVNDCNAQLVTRHGHGIYSGENAIERVLAPLTGDSLVAGRRALPDFIVRDTAVREPPRPALDVPLMR